MSVRLSLSRGIPVKIVDQVNVTGAADKEFCVPPIPGGPPKVQFSAVGAHTVLNGNIEATQDDGTTWRVHVAFDFIATKTINIELPTGVGYRFNIVTITGGPVDIYGSLR